MKKLVNGVEVTLTEAEETEKAAVDATNEAYYAANDYKQKRQKAYGPITEQLDMMFRDIDAGKLNKTGELYLHIKGVKDANPKPA